MSNLVLNGGVSNVKYIWHVESDKACEACQSLDGTEYNYEDDIPDRPHPNCRCYIEIVKNIENNQNQDQEPCDCWEQIQSIMDEVDELEGETNSLIDEMFFMQDEVENYLYTLENYIVQIDNLKNELHQVEPCGEDCMVLTGAAANITDDKKLEDLFFNIVKNNQSALEVYDIFLKNKHEMETTKNSYDKYYHAKANCEAAELGKMQAFFAGMYSIFKEIKDYAKKVFIEHQNAKKVYEDCLNDLIADLYGLQKAKEHGYCSYKVKDVEKIFKK